VKTKDNPKFCWKLINDFIFRGKINNSILNGVIKLNVNSDVQLISEKFNNYFINVASDLLNKLKDEQNLTYDKPEIP